MRGVGRDRSIVLLTFGLAVLFLAPDPASAQTNLRGQIIGPDGKMWAHEVRFMLVSSDGSFQQYFFTDSKGSFVVPGLRTGRTYTLYVDSDGQTYAATRVTFNLENIQYLSVFLEPLAKSKKAIPPPQGVDVSDLAGVPPDAARSYQEAVKRVQAGKLEGSVGLFEKAIEKHPGFYEAINNLGVVYLKLDRLPDAEKTLKKAAELKPEDFRPVLNLGIVHFRSGRFDVAATELARALQMKPGLTDAERYLGEALLELNRPDEAEKHLAAAMGANDDNRPVAMIKLAIVKVQQNDNASAIKLLEQYLAEYPKASNRSDIERILKQLK